MVRLIFVFTVLLALAAVHASAHALGNASCPVDMFGVSCNLTAVECARIACGGADGSLCARMERATPATPVNATVCTCGDGSFGLSCNETRTQCSRKYCDTFVSGQVCLSTRRGVIVCGFHEPESSDTT